MKILHINQSDWTASGGAGVLLQELHQQLLQRSVDSRILVKFSQLGSPRTTLKPDPLPVRLLESALKRLQGLVGLHECHRIFSSLLAKHTPAYQQADLLHLHAFYMECLSFLALPALTGNKPAVWTLHDMWPFTGHCYYSFDCERFESGCGHCPKLDVAPAIRRDGTRMQMRLREWAYARSQLTIITPSRWMEALARRSILKRFRIEFIPNGVDTTVYRPQPRSEIRSRLGLPGDKVILLTAALRVTDHRKGGDLLTRALKSLPEEVRNRIFLLVFGGKGSELLNECGLAGRDLGFLSEPASKADYYAAADLFLIPTRADNAPLVVLESLACATPVIAFNVGGLPEMVRPGQTGWLARAEDSADFAMATAEAVKHSEVRQEMGRRGRAQIEREFSIGLCAERHLKLYREILGTGHVAPSMNTTSEANSKL